MSEHAQPSPQPDEHADGDDQRVVVVTPQGVGIAEAAQEGGGPAAMVQQPTKVMRIGTMVKQLLEEVRAAPLDEAGRARLAQIHAQSLAELEEGLAPDLVEELQRMALPFGETTPSESELRVAQAQLVGWLEGLFHGIQTAVFAQQVAAQAQLAEMRRMLPGGPGPGAPQGAGPRDAMPRRQQGGTGQYL
ncbi:proteasome activator [Kineococcus glutinatus]|uniref:Bacterial proteasome activator n=1 Tax=Kineococcus glutinatus TaxID=1070872 RepID=A0ABP8VNI6_9ACTN